MMLTSRFL